MALRSMSVLFRSRCFRLARINIHPRLLVEGDRFVFDAKGWAVAEVYQDGLYTTGDPRMHFIFS